MVELTAEVLSKYVVSSRGDLALAAERATKRLEQQVTEYDIIEHVLSDPESVARVQDQLRALMTISVFRTLGEVEAVFRGIIDQISYNEIGRSYSMLVSAFSSLTANAGRLEKGADIELEAMKAASSLNLDHKAVLAELKDVVASNR